MISERDFEKLLFRKEQGVSRYTQDSPVYPDVWISFFKANAGNRLDLLFIPHRKSSVAKLLVSIRSALGGKSEKQRSDSGWDLASCGNSVVAKVTFEELLRILPMTNWWQKYLFECGSRTRTNVSRDRNRGEDYDWFRGLAGAILDSSKRDKEGKRTSSNPDKLTSELRDAFGRSFDIHLKHHLRLDEEFPCLWSVSLNRAATCTVNKSTVSTKSDAARRLFEVDGSGISWAVLDSGIDARHRAFRRPLRSNNFEIFSDTIASRVVETYDFTRLRKLMTNVETNIVSENKSDAGLRNKLEKKGLIPAAFDEDGIEMPKGQWANLLGDIERALKHGRAVDWACIAPMLRIPHTVDGYIPPHHKHGTHVAGIIGADMSIWKRHDMAPLEFDDVPPRKFEDFGEIETGICPGIKLYDLRVFDDEGNGDEFAILAAMQFVRWLNARSDHPVIHGVNLSMSLLHRVVNYACGRTPVCEECNKLTGEGVVVVSAAGNRGRAVYRTTDDIDEEGFRTVSVTDPGNADSVITVGSTHRNKPHSYGVSYFSSRGPTGDGRIKPDILAPGEKILSTIPGNRTESMDGTSMAAPHVSGAAALLLARHREMIGQPKKIKKILCETATDLGRERYFQGHGMLDVLRAMQKL